MLFNSDNAEVWTVVQRVSDNLFNIKYSTFGLSCIRQSRSDKKRVAKQKHFPRVTRRQGTLGTLVLPRTINNNFNITSYTWGQCLSFKPLMFTSVSKCLCLLPDHHLYKWLSEFEFRQWFQLNSNCINREEDGSSSGYRFKAQNMRPSIYVDRY